MKPLLSSMFTASIALLVSSGTAVGQDAAASNDGAPPLDAGDTKAPAPDEEPTEPWRAHRALGAPSWFLLSGSQRTRYQALANQFRPGLDDNDQALGLQLLVKTGLRLGPLSVVGEFQDARAYLTDEGSGVSPIMVDAVALLQAYVNVRIEDAFRNDAVLDLRLGRQMINVGSRRLVAGAPLFRSTLPNFTGLTSRWRAHSGAEVLAFWVLPVAIRPSNKQALIDNRIAFDEESIDLRFWGAFYRQPGLPLDLQLEVYFFGLNEDDNAKRATANRQLYTPGLRLFRARRSSGWDFDVENVVQFGKRRASSDPAATDDLRVRSHFHHVDAGYTFGIAGAPRLGVLFDYGSGDRGGTGQRYERFDGLFGPRRDFGPTELYGPLGRENLLSAGLRASFEAWSRLDGFVAWRANFLDARDDTFALTGVRDPMGQSGRFAGHQIEARARLWLLPDSIRWELGGAMLVQGPFLREAPNDNGYGNPMYAYTDLELFF